MGDNDEKKTSRSPEPETGSARRSLDTTTTEEGDVITPAQEVQRQISSQEKDNGDMFPPRTDVPPPPPNGGYGWVCCACVATINAHTWGLNSSYGVFLAHFIANNTFPGATSLHYAFVGSLSIACAMLVSPLA